MKQKISNIQLGVNDIFFGDLIGEGISRKVYDCKLDDSKVVKTENDDYFQNVLEFNTWCRVKDTKFSKWFAPCHWISSNGKVLIQSKTFSISEQDLPNKIPSFFTDEKKNNWGILNGKAVCHDYEINLLLEKGMKTKMKKVSW